MEREEVELNLDPDDWPAFRKLSHQILDDMLDYVKNIRNDGRWKPLPSHVKSHFQQSLPKEGQDRDEIYKEFQEYILPYPLGNSHPSFWGWVMGNGTPFAMMAELMAATVNPNMGGAEHAPIYTELQVINWMKEMLDFPQEVSGLLVSGGSMANLVGLTVARNTKAGYDVQTEGIQSSSPLIVYGSTESHSSLIKATRLIGIGTSGYRKIPVNERFEINIEALRKEIESDIKKGNKPICIVGNAGTVNTGACDDLVGLASIAKEHGLWFHIDGAFGALTYLSEEFRTKVKGLNLADSIAFDLHKWFYMPFEAGCVLVKREGKLGGKEDPLYNTFAYNAEYLDKQERGTGGGTLWLSDYGLQLTRGFKALKVWMSIKEHGIDKFGKLITQNIEQAFYLSELIKKSPNLQLMGHTYMNVVCYRFNPKDMNLNNQKLNNLNKELLLRLQEDQIAVPSSTILNDAFVIRLAITNHRTLKRDLEELVQESERIGTELL